MEDKRNKPLRPITNDKLKDLHNVYFNDPGVKNIPITTPEDEQENTGVSESYREDEITQNKHENEKIQENEGDEEIKKFRKDKNENLFNELKEKITALEKERDDFKDQAIRKTAELDNTLRRTLKEKNELIDYANKGLLQSFLPLMDDFDKAVDSGKKSQDYQSLLQGVEMIYHKTLKTFSDSGVKKMEIKPGEQFNVDFHEALLQIPSPEIAEGCIVQVAQDGFMYRDKVLRHAKVITSSGMPADNQQDEVEETSQMN